MNFLCCGLFIFLGIKDFRDFFVMILVEVLFLLDVESYLVFLFLVVVFGSGVFLYFFV